MSCVVYFSIFSVMFSIVGVFNNDVKEFGYVRGRCSSDKGRCSRSVCDV